MKRFTPVYLALAAASLVIAGCTKHRLVTRENDPISFSSFIVNNQSATRASAASWDANDIIGIWMLPKDGAIASGALSANNKYVTVAGDGNFAAASGQEIYFPKSGESVDFVAYYPWTDLGNSHEYRVDVTDQSSPVDIDLMYSNNAKGVTSGSPSLVFKHKLSKLVFNITDTDGASIEGLVATIDEMYSEGIYDLSAGKLTPTPGTESVIEMRLVSANGSKATVEAIVLPGDDLDFDVIFTSAGSEGILEMRDIDLQEGNSYIYDVEMGTDAIVVTGVATIEGWTENRGNEPFEISKKPAGAKGEKTGYLLETMGNGESLGGNRPLVNEYDGWDNPSINYTDLYGTVQVRSDNDDAFLRFLSGDAEMIVSGLPEGYVDITFSCDLRTPLDSGVTTDIFELYVGDVKVSPEGEVKNVPNFGYTTVSTGIPDGTTSVRLVRNPEMREIGLEIDNFKLEGRR